MNRLSFKSWSRRSLGIVACLFLAACSKTWPETVADLDDTWPLPEPEAQALRSLVGSSTLPPKHFAIWKERATIGGELDNGAVIREGHVIGVILQRSSLKTLAPVAALPHLVSLDVAHNALSALDSRASRALWGRTSPTFRGWFSCRRSFHASMPADRLPRCTISRLLPAS